MNTPRPSFFGRLFLFQAALGCSLHAQLAITEVMSSASTNLGPAQVVQNSDFWELTNFGTNTMLLTGYKFDDSDGNLAAADPTPFEGLSIGPGESVIFVQNNVNTNELAVRAWWGSALAATVQIVFYGGNGLSSGGDGIRLWGPDAQNPEDWVDSVDFGEAVRGSSFTYDAVTGEFGKLSTNGVGAAFKAEAADDVGSPGRATGPTPITIIQQPVDTIVNPGDNAVFTVQVRGRPRGSVQWFFGEAAIPGATNASVQIGNVQTSEQGSYYAVIDNAVTNIRSSPAQLVLRSEATAPVLTRTPAGVELYDGQSYTFSASATGSPQPVFQWQFKGQDIDGATGSEFTLAGVTGENTGTYAVQARNAVGSITNAFHVNVTPKPQLVITEAMSSSSTNGVEHTDWWEITNLGDFQVSLLGYRFDDNSEMLSAAFTLTNEVAITPGESIIFVEGMTAAEFRDWWGPEYLLPNLQILTYRGNGLSSAGDAINLWNAGAAEDSDKVASAVFSTATLGVSFGYDPGTGLFGALSSAGLDGAFVAQSGGDLGSPGYIRNSQRVLLPRLRDLQIQEGTLRLSWGSQAGKSYVLQSKANLDEAGWTDVLTRVADGDVTTVDQPAPAVAGHRFYRVLQQP